MNFVRSRVGLLGLVVAWPVAQLAGCTPTERQYDPPSGEGGDTATGGTMTSVGGAKGGAGGSKGGSGGTTGGTTGGSTSGDSGSGGDVASGGDSGSSTGGSSSGGTGTGGTAGTDNAGNGNEAGTGGTPVDPNCVPTGDEICSDGVDNDCDGSTDCLQLSTQFPLVNGAAAGNDVAYGFEVPATGATFQCRATHGDTPSGSFKPCSNVVESDSPPLRTVYPFDLTTASDPANDGYWTTEVRLRFANGATSDVLRRGVYIHSSLVGVTRCEELASTDAWVAAATAASHLPDAGAIVALTVRNPFVQIAFDPPVSARHHVGADDGLVKWRSLRRQFAFSSDKHYLVMTRTYTSRNDAGMGCYAVSKRIHIAGGTHLSAGHMTFQNCQAIVFNKAGAGYCLDHLGGSIVSVDFERAPTRATWVPAGTPPAGAYTYPANVLDTGYAPDADNLLWRKLTNRISPAAGGYMSNFSTKCDEEDCAATDTTGYTLFLPDKQYFNYWE